MARHKRKVVVYVDKGRRARIIGEAMGAGCIRNGCSVTYKPTEHYKKTIEGDIAIFYGFSEPLRDVFNTYRAADKTTIFVDLGYWGRIEGGRLAGYHKVVVNANHPVDYFQKYSHDNLRFERLGVDVKPVKIGGENILLCGMSAKAAGVFGYKAQMFEKKLLTLLKKISNRKIVYRPKPSWEGATPLPGASYSPASITLEQEFLNTFIVSTHHSNVSVDALVNGIPCNVNSACVAMPLSTPVDQIEKPYFPSDKKRYKWLCDVAYIQWKVEEMQKGLVWEHLRNEGLVK